METKNTIPVSKVLRVMDSSSNDSDLAQRILQAARHRFFRLGLRALTMDDLARDLGVSKKTLYVHFPSKSVIAEQIVDFIGRTMRSRFDKILDDPTLSLAQKLCAIVEVIGANIAQLSPSMLRDLQREAPGLYQKIEELRQKNIPYVFGRLLKQGHDAGLVRPEIDISFATEFWLHAVRGLMQPDALDRTGLTLKQTLHKAAPLFLNGILTPTGQADYTAHAASCAAHKTPR